MSDQDIVANLARIREHMHDAARAAGRDPASVRLIAVSKFNPAAAIKKAIAAGQKDFGENTVQEALGKLPEINAPGITWHFVGHVQSNKAKHIPGNFQWLHSLDSARLGARLARFTQEQNAKLDCLIEVNITGDPKKHGVEMKAIFPLLDELLQTDLHGVSLRGLMAMGPYPAPESEIRAAYAKVRTLRDECAARYKLAAFDQLSLGMSGDYVEAILEGATMVRVGTAIFDDRQY